MATRKFDDFDGFANDYREVHSKNVSLSGVDSYYFARMKVELLKDYEQDTSLKILDIGCGDGATELFMQEIFPSWRIDGIDISAKSISEAEKKELTNSRFVVYDGQEIPFPDESFDVIFMAGVLHHIAYEHHAKLLGETSRVLKKGGRFYVFEHNPLNPLTRYLVNTCEFDRDAKLLSYGYTKKLLKNAGLKVTGKKFIIFFPRKGFFKKLLFLEKILYPLPLGGQYFYRSVKS